MTRVVGRLSRLIDVASLLLVLAGFVLYVRAFLGMERVRTDPHVPFARGTMEAFALTNQYLRFQRLSYIAMGLVGAGIVIGLSAAAHHHKIRGRRPDSTQSSI